MIATLSFFFFFFAALELQPEDWVTLDYYGEVLGKLGRNESAVNVFNKAVCVENGSLLTEKL